jgi:ribosomal protein S18 acetylase RimI-like enzyme
MREQAGDLAIREADGRDLARVAAVMHDSPGPELLALIGDAATASAFGKGLVELAGVTNPARPTIVAERDDVIVGVLQYSVDGSSETNVGDVVRLGLRVAGPVRFLRALPRVRARQRVDLEAPPGSFYIAELQVAPECRGEGVGGRLLDWAEEEARRRGLRRVALVTHSTNRARHLYDRKGYVVTQTRTDQRYERYTGIPGRVLMEKTVG